MVDVPASLTCGDAPSCQVANDAYERAAKSLEISNSEILLAAGEMSAQELRSVRAVLDWRARHIRGMKNEPSLLELPVPVAKQYCKERQSGSLRDSPEAAIEEGSERPVKPSSERFTPVAFGAHRYGQWGYIWHARDDVEGWIERANATIADPCAHWHGPVELFDDIEALAAEVELKSLCIAGMAKEAEKLASRLERSRQWYAVRLKRLEDLARALPEDVQKQFFSIVANAAASPTEEPGYDGQMNLLRHQRDVMALRADNYAAMLGRMTYATRHSSDAKILGVRTDAIDLIRKTSAANPLRTKEGQGK